MVEPNADYPLHLRAAISGRLDTGRIRLKADFGPPVGIILADQDGVVLDVTRGLTFQLTKDLRHRVEREIEPFVGAVDITTFERERRPKVQ